MYFPTECIKGMVVFEKSSDLKIRSLVADAFVGMPRKDTEKEKLGETEEFSRLWNELKIPKEREIIEEIVDLLDKKTVVVGLTDYYEFLRFCDVVRSDAVKSGMDHLEIRGVAYRNRPPKTETQVVIALRKKLQR